MQVSSDFVFVTFWKKIYFWCVLPVYQFDSTNFVILCIIPAVWQKCIIPIQATPATAVKNM